MILRGARLQKGGNLGKEKIPKKTLGGNSNRKRWKVTGVEREKGESRS